MASPVSEIMALGAEHMKHLRAIDAHGQDLVARFENELAECLRLELAQAEGPELVVGGGRHGNRATFIVTWRPSTGGMYVGDHSLNLHSNLRFQCLAADMEFDKVKQVFLVDPGTADWPNDKEFVVRAHLSFDYVKKIK